MKEKITPCLWFDGQAKEAAALYCAAFKNAKIVAQSPIVTAIDLSGQSFTLLDGGPSINPILPSPFFISAKTLRSLIVHGMP